MSDRASNPYRDLREGQREFFLAGHTRSRVFREGALKLLYATIKRRETEVLEALRADLGKSETEAFSNEVGIVYLELRHAWRNLGRWMRSERVAVDAHLLPGSGRIEREPYGSSLVIAPWNYPFQLLLSPLVGAIAAGNTATLKPSELAPRTAAVCASIIEDCFERDFVAVVDGGVGETTALLALDWDHVFFTGSVPVGRIVMKAAAEHLAPVTLELGGKSPAFVARTADLRLAARRIAWGKYNNAGQTCVAPDYVLVDAAVREEFVAELSAAVEEFYGGAPRESGEYGRIVNDRHFERLRSLIDPGRLVFGGETDAAERYIAPSAFFPVEWDHPLMADEIFGPLLPIVEYRDLELAIDEVRRRPKPLSLYVFARDKATRRHVVSAVSAGGACENDVMLHVASTRLPFGGVGTSGLGSYHGRASFEAFSHRKSVYERSFGIDLPLAYPHKKLGLDLLRRVMR